MAEIKMILLIICNVMFTICSDRGYIAAELRRRPPAGPRCGPAVTYRYAVTKITKYVNTGPIHRGL